MRKEIMLKTSIVIALFFSILGCNASSTNNEQIKNEPSGSQEQIKLSFWHHTYPPADELIKEKIKKYEEMNPNVKIEFVTHPAGSYDSKISVAFTQGNAPDIVNLLDYALPAFQSKLQPAPPEAFGVKTTKEIEDLYVPGALNGLKQDDSIYMIPEELDTMALFLNSRLFKEAGLDANDPNIWPKTWNELFELAKKLTKYDSNGRITQIGFNWVWGLDPFWYAQQYWPILAQYGGSVFSEDGKTITVNSPETVKAFSETWEYLIKNNIGGPKVGQANAANGLQSFSQGQQAMAIAGPWAPSMFNDQVKSEYVVAPFPQLDPAKPKTMLYTYGLAVTKNSAHPLEAWKFLNFLTSDSDAYLSKAGYITGRKDWDSTQAAKNLRGKDIWTDGIKKGIYIWRSSNWLQEGTIMKQAIESFGSGSMTVQQALDQAAQQLKSLSK